MPQLTPEYIYVEKLTIDQLTSIGWQHIEGSWDNPQVTERTHFKQVLITGRLRAAIKRINLDDNGKEWLDDTQVNAAVSQLERLGAQRLMEANFAATELLLKGTTVLGQDGKQHTVQFIDEEHCDRNDFLAINQYRVDPPWATGNRGFIVPDIVLLVNGIPLVVIECKSPNLDKPPGAGLVSGMIQKFKGGEDSEEEEQIEPMAKNLNPSKDILVLIDEAHRSHTSTLHANLLEALPNYVRIGFTGTPIVKAAKKTPSKFLVLLSTSTTSAHPKKTALLCPSSLEGLEARGTLVISCYTQCLGNRQ